jgi:hypothetical protein
MKDFIYFRFKNGQKITRPDTAISQKVKALNFNVIYSIDKAKKWNPTFFRNGGSCRNQFGKALR